jgi:peptidoglycan-N-acetylglucosamine deacetylase
LAARRPHAEVYGRRRLRIGADRKLSGTRPYDNPSVWIVIAVTAAVVALAHTAPAPFLFDLLAGQRAAWHMPKTTPPAIYLTYDDGPNPTTTPDLLDVLAREHVFATFFLIDRHITEDTVALVQRMFTEGHAVAVHSHTRAWMLMSADEFAATVTRIADHIEQVARRRPCAAFRPHAGWRTWSMYRGLKKIDYRMVGWSWMLWDWNWFRRRTADSVVDRISHRAGNGDIIVMHDGDESAPLADQRQTVDATARLIPVLRSRGFVFQTICAANQVL